MKNYLLQLFRKKLKKGVLLHVHVNLAVALLLALLFFVFGVDLAISNSVRQTGTTLFSTPFLIFSFGIANNSHVHFQKFYLSTNTIGVVS